MTSASRKMAQKVGQTIDRRKPSHSATGVVVSSTSSPREAIVTIGGTAVPGVPYLAHVNQPNPDVVVLLTWVGDSPVISGVFA